VTADPREASIAFRCVRADHAQRSRRLTMTIHDGRWAFCQHDGATNEHQWVPTGGVTLRELLLSAGVGSARKKRGYVAGASDGRATKR
jgi:hypothetical protein